MTGFFSFSSSKQWSTKKSISPEFIHYSLFLSSLPFILLKSHPYSLYSKKDILFPVLLCVLAPPHHVKLTFTVSLPLFLLPLPCIQSGYDAWSSGCHLAAGGDAKRIPECQFMLRYVDRTLKFPFSRLI